MDQEPVPGRTTHLLRKLGLAAAALVLLLTLNISGGPAQAAPVPAPSPGPVVQEPAGSSPAEARNSWSRADMLNAKPADLPGPDPDAFDLPAFPDASISARSGAHPVADPTAYPARIQGKVFFKIGATSYQCSATLVESRMGNALFTAGHCVYDIGSRAFVTDFVFVPGYADGNAPLGVYPATRLFTTTGWVESGNFSYDIGVATLAGTPEADLGPGRKIAFNLNPDGRKYTIFGYPADPKPQYDGQRLITCGSRVVGRDTGSPRPLAATPCDMGHGASGGGWISGGYLNSVTSYIYCESSPESCGYVFGPYFSNAARKMYTRPEIGGSLNPSFRISHRPPRKVTKRKVVFRFAGKASTPLRFKCSFDRRRYEACGSRTTVSRLTPGSHVLRVQASDQTGRRAPGTRVARFRVALKR